MLFSLAYRIPVEPYVVPFTRYWNGARVVQISSHLFSHLWLNHFMYVFFVFTTRLKNPPGQESTLYPSLVFSWAFGTLFVGLLVCFTELIVKKCLLCTCEIETTCKADWISNTIFCVENKLSILGFHLALRGLFKLCPHFTNTHQTLPEGGALTLIRFWLLSTFLAINRLFSLLLKRKEKKKKKSSYTNTGNSKSMTGPIRLVLHLSQSNDIFIRDRILHATHVISNSQNYLAREVLLSLFCRQGLWGQEVTV